MSFLDLRLVLLIALVLSLSVKNSAQYRKFPKLSSKVRIGSLFDFSFPSPKLLKIPLTIKNINGKRNSIISLLVFFMIGVSNANASPLNPQIVSVRNPFFQGWLIRVVDHVESLSFMVIVGSFSEAGSNVFTEHYVFCGINSRFGSSYYHKFPSPGSVRITGLPPSTPSLILESKHPLNIRWEANNLGYFRFDDERCQVNFNFEEMHVECDIRKRCPWSDTNELIGPEGWLGYTSLLACHYFIHTIGSECEYKLKLKQIQKSIEGKGYSHIEGNHGSFFPIGWVWAQSIAPNNYASFSLVGGKFEIGSMNPMNWTFYLRTKRKRSRIFRTTDGARVSYKVDSLSGVVFIEAESFFRTEKVVVEIEAGKTLEHFSPPLYTPGPVGFSNNPGCRECYTAVAKMRCFDFDVFQGKFVLSEEVSFPLTVLEFGGVFLGQVLSSGVKKTSNVEPALL